jgi:aminopeptidase N
MKILDSSNLCLFLIALVLGTGCGSLQNANRMAAPGAGTVTGGVAGNSTESMPAPPLLETEAQLRAQQVGNVIYTLWFGLEGTKPDFEGRASIQFEVDPKAKIDGQDLFVDFSEGSLSSIQLNGNVLQDLGTKERYDGNRIYFKMNELYAGTNRIQISFRHPYSHNGHGLHRFVDPADKKVYLYSDLEPYFAHTIFPCFDQPDLKAKFEVTVDAPTAWQVITNTREAPFANPSPDLSTIANTNGNAVKNEIKTGHKTWVFAQTLPLSTYIFALIAGDYTSWSADADGIPLRLFARQSLKKYVDAKEWFDISRKGLAFYAKQFGRAYPFPKYDQILVPEFDEGAMENAGAVTHSERMVFRTKVTRLTRERRADTILHEMAHMWFGDLVTLKWWNGLWLNESFATFMSSWAMSVTLPIPGMNENSAWESFSAEKEWAYWQDQLVTTHPIELPVENTDQAFSNFDGITYGKGASVIKQLRYYLGEEKFRNGIQLYFQKYAFGNTRLEDFMGALSEASGVDLKEWQKNWLMTAGVNSVKTEWTCKAGKISKLTLWQAPAEMNSVLRAHRTALGFYFLNPQSKKIEIKNTIPVTYEAKRTAVKDAVGLACPDFIYPNAHDDDYVKVELDPKSLEEVSAHLSQIDDTLTKLMLWYSLSEMMTDGKLSARDYAEVLLKQLPTENNIEVEHRVLKSLGQVLYYMTPHVREQYYRKFEVLTENGLHAAKAGSDSQLEWFTAFVDFSHNPPRLQALREILNGKLRIPKLKIDQEVRWNLVAKLARSKGTPDAEALIQKESKADPTDMGKKSALGAEVGRPDPNLKSQWVDKIFAAAATGTTADLSGADLRTVMSNFYVLGQDAPEEAVLPRYFQFLPEAMKSKDETYAENYTRRFFPDLCTRRVIDLTNEALKQNLPASAQKYLRVNKQETERCVRARSL